MDQDKQESSLIKKDILDDVAVREPVPAPDRPQTLAMDNSGTPFGSAIDNASPSEQLDYQKIQEEAQRIREAQQ